MKNSVKTLSWLTTLAKTQTNIRGEYLLYLRTYDPFGPQPAAQTKHTNNKGV